MIIGSKAALDLLLQQKISDVLNILVEKIHEQLRININLYTYGYGYGGVAGKANVYGEPINDVYEDGTGIPSYQFRDEAWVVEKANMLANEMIASIQYDGMLMDAPSAAHPFRHGNYKKGIDRRARLANILNVDGPAGERDWPLKGLEIIGLVRKPFFDITIEWIDKNWDSLVKNAFKKVGLTIK